MGKRLETGELKDSCLENVRPGEPFFVLKANDVTSPWIIRQWAARAQSIGTPQTKIDEALACAAAMEEWVRTGTKNDKRGKIPD